VIYFTFKNIICYFWYKSQFALGQNYGLFEVHLVLEKSLNEHQEKQFCIKILTAKYIINYIFTVTLLFGKKKTPHTPKVLGIHIFLIAFQIKT